jgi:hypothetical protein
MRCYPTEHKKCVYTLPQIGDEPKQELGVPLHHPSEVQNAPELAVHGLCTESGQGSDLPLRGFSPLGGQSTLRVAGLAQVELLTLASLVILEVPVGSTLAR